MKKLLLLAFAAFFVTAGIQAQTMRRSDSTARKEFRQQLKKDNRGEMKNLNLTADQKAKMKTLRQENMKNRQAIMQDKALTQEQRKQKLEDLRKQNKQNMDAVLTPAQKTQMDQFRKERTAKNKNWKKGQKGNRKSGNMRKGAKTYSGSNQQS